MKFNNIYFSKLNPKLGWNKTIEHILHTEFIIMHQVFDSKGPIEKSAQKYKSISNFILPLRFQVQPVICNHCNLLYGDY